MNRLIYLDLLRAIAVLLSVLAITLHSWTAFYDWCSLIILPVLVCISTYFSASVLRIHTFRSFFNAKWLRLGIPWVVAAVLFAPEEAYVTYLQQGGSLGWFDFYLQHWENSQWAVSSHWFLGFLLLSCLVLMGLKKGNRQLLQHRVQSRPSPVFFIAFIVISTLLLYGISCIPALHIAGVHILPPRADWLCISILYVVLGIYAFRHRWFTANGYIPPRGCFIAFLCANVAYGIAMMQPLPRLPLLLPILQSLLTLTSVLGLTAVFHAIPSGHTVKAHTLCRYSYPFYFISEPIIFNAWYVLQMLTISLPLKVILVLLLTGIYGSLICKYALLHFPSFKRII